jgi:hypothetical protein
MRCTKCGENIAAGEREETVVREENWVTGDNSKPRVDRREFLSLCPRCAKRRLVVVQVFGLAIAILIVGFMVIGLF